MKVTVENGEKDGGKEASEMNKEGGRYGGSELSVLRLNPAGCCSPTSHLHIKLARWLLSLSEGQLLLFLLV